MNDPYMASQLDAGQDDDHVWKNVVLCANCGYRLGEHCRVHLFPCCPGKCPRETAD